MRDTFDLTPPQRTPVIRSTASARAASGGAEQSWHNWPVPGFPFEDDGAEQSFLNPQFNNPFE
jgi:hypothetical protein